MISRFSRTAWLRTFPRPATPNGWMTKPQFLLTYAVVILPALAAEFWLPRKSPDGDNRLRLPNEEFWLAPERRAESLTILNFFAWYGCAFLLLEVFAMGLAMRANFQSPPQLPTGPIVLRIAAFVLFNIVWVAAMVRRFSKLRKDNGMEVLASDQVFWRIHALPLQSRPFQICGSLKTAVGGTSELRPAPCRKSAMGRARLLGREHQ